MSMHKSQLTDFQTAQPQNKPEFRMVMAKLDSKIFIPSLMKIKD